MAIIEQIEHKALTLNDNEWFIKEFVRSLMHIYSSKEFYIKKNNEEVLIGVNNLKEKEEWLVETAKNEFNDYVANPKPGYQAQSCWLNIKPIGVVLYRLNKDESTVYLAQGFVIPEYQKQGIGSSLLIILMQNLSNEYHRFDVLARHQNDAAISLYNSLGFKNGGHTIVNKYGYSPMKYFGLFKEVIGNLKKNNQSLLGIENLMLFHDDKIS